LVQRVAGSRSPPRISRAGRRNQRDSTCSPCVRGERTMERFPDPSSRPDLAVGTSVEVRVSAERAMELLSDHSPRQVLAVGTFVAAVFFVVFLAAFFRVAFFVAVFFAAFLAAFFVVAFFVAVFLAAFLRVAFFTAFFFVAFLAGGTGTTFLRERSLKGSSNFGL